MKQAFLVVLEIEVTDAYVEHIGGVEVAAEAIAGAVGGLLNPPDTTSRDEWKVVDATAYPLAR